MILTFMVNKQIYTKIDEAILAAREAVQRSRKHKAIPIFCSTNMAFIALVSSNLNGLTVDRLSGWPKGLESIYV